MRRTIPVIVIDRDGVRHYTYAMKPGEEPGFTVHDKRPEQ